MMFYNWARNQLVLLKFNRMNPVTYSLRRALRERRNLNFGFHFWRIQFFFSSRKAAVLSHFNLVNSGIHLGNRSQYNEKPHRLCVPVPFFHAGGIVASMATAISYGATIVLPAPSFNAEKSLRAVGDEK